MHKLSSIFYLLFAAILLVDCKQIAQKSVTDNIKKQVTLQLNPGENNPRNSEGDFITLKDGKHILLAYCAGSQSKKTHLSVTRISRISLHNLYSSPQE